MSRPDGDDGRPADDLGWGARMRRPVARVVSLVPSLTESVAASAPGLLVGATKWCVEPSSLRVERVGGTKNPDVARIVGLDPDLVLANEEENRPSDLAALRSAGVAVWVTRIRSVPEAFVSLDRMLRLACGLERPAWLGEAQAAWRGLGPAGSVWARAVVPIWRRPWMVLGCDTFAGDVLARLGVANVFASLAERYPRMALEELRARGADLVALPDEPYPFSEHDGPEAFGQTRVALLSGRHLTWYGPSLAQAPAVLARQLRAARVYRQRS